MRKVVGDNFGEVEKYKLYRSVYEILHPTISKRNISNYKIIFDEKLLPVVVFYPAKISNINSVIIYLPGDGHVNGCFGKYTDICKSLAKESNSIVVAIDYFNSTIKYPTVVNKVFKLIQYLYKELNENGIENDKITLLSDSISCKIMGNVITKLLSKDIMVNKNIMLYPVVRDSYNDYQWNEAVTSINFNLDKRVMCYLERYYNKKIKDSNDLNKLVYYKNFPKTLVITGDMDLFRDDGCDLAEILISNVCGSSYSNIEFASHGFLGSSDDVVKREAYRIISEFVLLLV